MTRDIHPLTPDRFADFEAVLGRGGQGGCWCMYWIHPDSKTMGPATKGGSKAQNRDLFRALVAEGPPPGLIGYDDGQPVAWARVTPRAALPGLKRSRFYKVSGADEGVWSISCFVVRTRHRGQGWTGTLIDAAISFARAHGARILEAYGNDPETPITPAAAYTGLASTFARAGFEEVTRRPGKVVMRRAL